MACRCRTTKKMFAEQTSKIIRAIKHYNKQYRNFDGSDEFGGSPFMENYEEYETWSNAGGDPSVVVGGETFDMQPTLTWNRRNFFGKQDGGFGSSRARRGANMGLCPDGVNLKVECGNPKGCPPPKNTGLPRGMGVEYRQI